MRSRIVIKKPCLGLISLRGLLNLTAPRLIPLSLSPIPLAFLPRKERPTVNDGNQPAKKLTNVEKNTKYHPKVSGIFLKNCRRFDRKMSEKREKFVRLAEQRVNRALNDIRLIGNLSNRSAYSFSDEDIKKIFKTLQKELDQAKTRFSDAENAAGGDFKL